MNIWDYHKLKCTLVIPSISSQFVSKYGVNIDTASGMLVVGGSKIRGISESLFFLSNDECFNGLEMDEMDNYEDYNYSYIMRTSEQSQLPQADYGTIIEIIIDKE